MQTLNLIDLASSINSNKRLLEKFNIFSEIRISDDMPLCKWNDGWPLPRVFDTYSVEFTYNGRSGQKAWKRYLIGKVISLEDMKKRKVYAHKYIGGRGTLYLILNGWVWGKFSDNWCWQKIPKTSGIIISDNSTLTVKLPRSHFCIKYRANDGNTDSIILPKKIILDELFFEGLGLYFGEGSKSFGESHVTFTNTDFFLIEHMVIWFQRFGLSLEGLKFYIERTKNNPNACPAYEFLTKIGVKKGQIKVTSIKKTGNKLVIDIVIHNKLFKVMILQILGYFSYRIPNNTDWSASFIRGLIASEGCVRLFKPGLIHSVKISCANGAYRKLYLSCLNTVGIHACEDLSTPNSESVAISRLENYKKLKDINAFKLSKTKSVKFLRGLSTYKKLKLLGR